MKKIKEDKRLKIMAGVLVLLMSIFFLAPNQLAADVCDEALVECAVDAVIIAVFSGFQNGALYFSGCLIGYSWCLEYFD